MMEKTIFFGNGLNRLERSNISWGGLLDKIKDTKAFADNNLPNTMIYERIVLQKLTKFEDILDDEFEVKVEIANLLKEIKGHEIYQQLYMSKAEHYITTNYDYGFLDSILDLEEVNKPIFEYSTERVYSIRRRKRISNSREAKKIFWQIHGEVRSPSTIMLGMDQYCGSIGRLNDYVKGKYKYQLEDDQITEVSIEEKLTKGSLTDSSWVELFFATDVHIMGFTFDFSEIDLWWLLTRRARMKRSPRTSMLVKNTIHFYCHEIEEQKKALFESLLVKVHVLPLGEGNDKYLQHYQTIIRSI